MIPIILGSQGRISLMIFWQIILYLLGGDGFISSNFRFPGSCHPFLCLIGFRRVCLLPFQFPFLSRTGLFDHTFNNTSCRIPVRLSYICFNIPSHSGLRSCVNCFYLMLTTFQVSYSICPDLCKLPMYLSPFRDQVLLHGFLAGGGM